MMKRIIGVDYGTRRIGIAISDPLGITARGLESIPNRDGDNSAALARLIELVKEYEVETLVFGLPKRSDGKPSESEAKTRAFAELLAANCSCQIHFLDERFTTRIAHQILNASSIKGARRKREVVDQVAAEVILKDYLESQRTVL